MVEAGEGPKAALLRAACSWDVRGRGEGSQALTLAHWSRTVGLPGKLKRGGIINKSSFTGLRVKGAATERNRPASAWSPASKGCSSPGGRRMGREKCRGAEGRGFLFTATRPAPIGKLPGSQQNDPGSPVPQADGSLVLQHHGHTSLSSQQKDLMCTGMAVTCRPAERTQPPFNEASLIAFLWGALYKESSCCFLLWGGGSWRGVAREVAGITSRSGDPGVLGCCSSPLGVAVPCDQAALLAGPEVWECWRGL